MNKLLCLTCFFLLTTITPQWLSAQVERQPSEDTTAPPVVYETVSGFSSSMWYQADLARDYTFDDASKDTINTAHALAWGYFHIEQGIANAAGKRLVPLFLHISYYNVTTDSDYNCLIEAEYTITYIEVDFTNAVYPPPFYIPHKK